MIAWFFFVVRLSEILLTINKQEAKRYARMRLVAMKWNNCYENINRYRIFRN